MRPSINEARYHIALERLAEASGRERSELDDEITEEAAEVRNR